MFEPDCLRRCGCSWYRRARLNFDRRVACLDGPGRCVCWSAVARPRDRHTRASLGVVDLEARPGPAAADQHRALALPPPTGTAARFSGLSGALHTSGACCAEDDSPRLEARPGPATAHGHRSLALRSLRYPPHQWGLLCCGRFASSRGPPWPCRRRPAPRPAMPPPTGTLAGPTAPLAPRPGPPFPPTLSCGVRVLDRKFCCG